MNASAVAPQAAPTSILDGVAMAPKDPILGVTEAYVADKNPKKVNLGVGVYYDENGKVPVLECVKEAEDLRIASGTPKSYLPIDGLAAYDNAVRGLIFGADSPAVRDGRVLTVQALGGTGGLKIGADFLHFVTPGSTVWISDPSWENHRALFEAAGFKVEAYPYYDPKTRGVKIDEMLAALDKLPAGAIVVLHACCHNPTGADIAAEDWPKVIEVVKRRGLVPFLDLAYQGFSDTVENDGLAVTLFSQAMSPVFVSSSFSKSFSLYGERVGAFSLLTASAEETARALSQIKRIVRTNYSNPPTHGCDIVARVLCSSGLRKHWDTELGAIRDRIKSLRKSLVDGIHARVPGSDFSFMLRQKGMFSYSGLTKEQVGRLREEYSIYALDTGRICVAALNSRNIDYVADAIAKVIR